MVHWWMQYAYFLTYQNIHPYHTSCYDMTRQSQVPLTLPLKAAKTTTAPVPSRAVRAASPTASQTAPKAAALPREVRAAALLKQHK